MEEWKMIWQIDGEVIALLIVVSLLYDIIWNKYPDESRRENLFRNLTATSAVALTIGILSTLFSPAYFNAPFVINEVFKALHVFFFPCILLIWMHFTLRSIPVGHRQFRIFMLAGDILLGIFSFILMMQFIIGGLFIFDLENHPVGGIGFHLLFGLCLLYSSTSLLLVVRHAYRMQRNKVKAFILFPSMFIISTIIFYLVGSHVLFSVSTAITILLNYLILQNRKLTYDTLTGLPNRKAFLQSLEKTIARNIKGCVLVADIENFKFFNHRFGQANGDILLVQLGDFLVTTTPNHTVYRISGDQFAMILRRMDQQDVIGYIETLRDRFEQPWTTGGIQSLVNMHYAIVCFPSQAQRPDQVLHAMDFTLSEAKVHRSKNVAYYDNQAMRKHERNQEILEALRTGIFNGTLTVHYQPIYELSTDSIVGAEALARLHDPVLGTIAPCEFIPIAEESGLIVDMTHLVIQRVCDLWKQIGPSHPSFKHIAVNLSSVNFMQPSMEADILSQIRANLLPPECFIFELTESMLVESFERVNQTIVSLATHGVTFSLDDYGTGYSNIEYLMRLPFQAVKLDRSIIQHSDTHRDLLESIVLMLHKIGKTIVAEGVETETQLALMRELGIDHVQGYLLGKPMPGEAFADLCQARTCALQPVI
jgi:diguanylate cyclase (GGDEF)-like protein